MGLLSPQVAKTGLLALVASGQIRPPMADAGDERMIAANPNGGYGAEKQKMMMQASAPQAAPQAASAAGLLQPPQRQRVSGWRMLDRVLFGSGPIGAELDGERERLRTEAMRPTLLAREERLRGFAQGMGPAAEIAFEGNRPEFASSLGQQFRPMAAAEGTGITIPGTGQTFFNERKAVVGDRVVGMGTNEQAPRELLTVSPSYSDQTTRADNLADNLIAQGELGVKQGQLGINQQTADRPEAVTTTQGAVTNLISPAGAIQGTIQGNPVQTAGRNGAAFDATTRGELSSARTSAGTATRRVNDARRFIALNQKNGTGIGAALLGPAAGLSPEYAEMRAISASLIPKEREPGSGPMSDRDVLLYGRAVIDIDKPGRANQAIANAVIAQAQRDIEYSAFLDEYAQRNGNNVGATEDWTAYVNANPLFSEDRNGVIQVQPPRQSWRDFMGFGARQRGGSGGASGNGAPVRISGDADYNALPSGTQFTAPDGSVRVKP